MVRDRDPVIGRMHLIDQQAGGAFMLLTTAEILSVVPEIAYGQAAAGSAEWRCRTRFIGDVGESSVAVVVIKNSRFLKVAAEVLAVDFGIDVAVNQQKIGPAVIVEVEEHRAPSQILRVQAESGGEGDVVECAVAVVAIEGGGVVGEIGFEDVELAVAIEVGDGRCPCQPARVRLR